ncbi:unnamed protein product [Rotaria sp. Silwood2]|nr:unnamed protein product [Rotaria sp. Silwood2]CAF4261317.1 unnamed protein product [Rotaria sp. Silwood2]
MDQSNHDTSFIRSSESNTPIVPICLSPPDIESLSRIKHDELKLEFNDVETSSAEKSVITRKNSNIKISYDHSRNFIDVLSPTDYDNEDLNIISTTPGGEQPKHQNFENQVYRETTCSTSKPRRSLRIKSTLHVSAPNPQECSTGSLFSNGFDELCSWLIEILYSGLIVSMVDISIEYETIIKQRNEKLKPNMCRTSCIQDRLKFKYGDLLHFVKKSNTEGVFVGLSDPAVYMDCALQKPKVWKRQEPPGDLLGNELYRHERSEQLLTITNRLGHTPSYSTIVRLHAQAAERSRMTFKPFFIEHQQTELVTHNFVVKVADNFDINPDRLHGNNSIHILNQILISTPENDELPNLIIDCLNDLLDTIVNSNITNTISSEDNKNPIHVTDHTFFSKRMFVNESLHVPLLAYGLIKFVNDTTRRSFNYLSPLIRLSVPIMSGFFATYLSAEKRPLHIISFMTPINDDPSSELAAEKCLEETQQLFIDSNYQKEGIVVVDEKIYRSCMKVKRYEPEKWNKIFVYPGDFHLMKNMMVVIWEVLQGSGIEGLLEKIYKGASLRSILKVSHFNKSLRSCKLLYTALHILLLEAFFDQTATSSMIVNCTNNLKSIMSQIPSEFAADDVCQAWFTQLLEAIEENNLLTYLKTWCINSSNTDSTFRLWFFILERLLQPLMQFYVSILEIEMHSGIALDQTIECTINKHGKGSGGINGRQSEQSIDTWIHSFGFRALLTSCLHEICGIETADNSIDSHIECTANRKAIDDTDLSMLVEKLRGENLFTQTNSKCHKIHSSLVIHDDIVKNITSLYQRGVDALSAYINERLVLKTIPVDSPLKAMHLLKLENARTYISNSKSGSSRRHMGAEIITKYSHLVKVADQEMRRTIIIAQQRNLKPLSKFFGFEYSPIPLSLCNSHNTDLLNQQTKVTAMEFLKKNFSASFSSSYPIPTHQSALVIDGNSLFETKPKSEVKTIREYAIQLLNNNIRHLFEIHDRIDVIFQNVDTKILEPFININEEKDGENMYELRCNDLVESPFKKFVHSNRVSLGKCIRQCWTELDLNKYLPYGRVLVIGGPDSTAVKLQYGHAVESDYLLESHNPESRTRFLLHCNVISLDQCQNVDVILLSIALASNITLQHLAIKSTNTRTQNDIFIDVKSIVARLRRVSIDPTSLLVLNALSGCSTTSTIRNVTKEKIFNRFFDDPDRYSCIIELNSIPPPYEAIVASERLLIDCYPLGRIANSLNELRALMAEYGMKDRTRVSFASNLPPSRSAFKQHCLRAARQIKIWMDCLDPNPIAPPLIYSGYEQADINGEWKIKWTDNPERPLDTQLETCGNCKTTCNRCRCWKNNVACTFYCKCDVNACINQPSPEINNFISLTSTDLAMHSTSDDFYSTDESVLSDTDHDSISSMSESSHIYNETDESDIDINNYDEINGNLSLNHSIINTSSTTSQCDPTFHITRDHNYSINHLNDDNILNFTSTPKRQRTSSGTSSIFNISAPCSSPLVHSTPKTQLLSSPNATNFKTPFPPSKYRVRPATHFRKTYGPKVKHSQEKK